MPLSLASNKKLRRGKTRTQQISKKLPENDSGDLWYTRRSDVYVTTIFLLNLNEIVIGDTPSVSVKSLRFSIAVDYRGWGRHVNSLVKAVCPGQVRRSMRNVSISLQQREYIFTMVKISGKKVTGT